MNLSRKLLGVEQFPLLSWFQGPQLLRSSEARRIFFSTRIQEGNYFYSQVCSVALDSNLDPVIDTFSSKVISRSELGTFDHDGIFPFHVFRTPNNRVLGFTCGWKRKVSVDIDMSIGISESHDGGLHFERLGSGPIMTSNLSEPYLVGDPYVLADENGLYHMYYIAGDAWLVKEQNQPERQYSIKHATSSDLIEWKRTSTPVVPHRISFEAQAMPSVVKLGNTYHMFYCYRSVFDFRSNPDFSYKIGHAYSDSLFGPWTTSQWNFPKGSLNEWNDSMQCYPHAFVEGGDIFLLYNGNGFGRFGICLLVIEAEELDKYAQF